MPSCTLTKDDLLERLRRIEGQTLGFPTMVEADRYCIDVPTQMSACVGASEHLDEATAAIARHINR